MQLTDALKPTVLNIFNDSHLHRHHAAMKEVEDKAETHFRVEIHSQEFSGKTSVQRHRMVYVLLADEIEDGVHSLQITAKE